MPKLKTLNKETVSFVLLNDVNLPLKTIGEIVELIWHSDERLEEIQRAKADPITRDWSGEEEDKAWENLRHVCGDCGEELQIVRPGKYQCVNPECVSR